MKTLGHLIADITERFTRAGIDTARLDARVLTGHALGMDASRLFARSDELVDEAAAARLEGLVRQRLDHTPVSRIVGHREFWGMDFKLGPDTLDPRPDTEAVVAAALMLKPALKAPRVLDLGTGTGCILLAILKDWPEATGLGIDVSAGALATAAENAGSLGLASRAAFRQSNWCDAVSETFDIVVSNPPYITEAEMAGLAPEVALFDPERALVGGADGLGAYRLLIPQAWVRLHPGGRLFLEIGQGQGPAVARLLEGAGFHLVGEHKDLAGILRCLEAERV